MLRLRVNSCGSRDRGNTDALLPGHGQLDGGAAL
jgi:hypothetical protein